MGEQTSHTPGPWRVGQGRDGFFNVWVMAGEKQLVADVIRAADAPSFQFCTGPADEDESIANARLVAAAPDLLAALIRWRELRHLAESEGASGYVISVEIEALTEAVDAAIEKALGTGRGDRGAPEGKGP